PGRHIPAAGVAVGSFFDAHRTRRPGSCQRAGDAPRRGSARHAQGIEAGFQSGKIAGNPRRGAQSPHLAGTAGLFAGFARCLSAAPQHRAFAARRTGVAARRSSMGADAGARHGFAGGHPNSGRAGDGASARARHRAAGRKRAQPGGDFAAERSGSVAAMSFMSGRNFPALAPTRHLAKLAFLLSAVLYAAVSQNNGAAYVLLFLLTSVLLVSVLHMLLNLRGLKISVEAIKPAFAGQEISVPLEIVNQCRK